MSFFSQAAAQACTARSTSAAAAGVFCPWIGRTGGNNVVLGDARPVAIEELRLAHESWFPRYMDGSIA